MKGFLAGILHLLPLRLISAFSGWIASLKLPSGLMESIGGMFARAYGIDLSEAEKQPGDYPSFNQFFYRALKPGARKTEVGLKAVVSPVDGTILTMGELKDDIIIEAKGTGSPLEELIPVAGISSKLRGGAFMVIYVSPRDYHRIHSPVRGEITGYSHVPGRLFPVNSFAVNNIDRLFSRNERLVTYMKAVGRTCALVKVGATNVGSIRVQYMNELKTNRRFSRKPVSEIFMTGIKIRAAEEVGRFELGSTVILLFEKNMIEWKRLKSLDKVTVGQQIGEFI